MQALFPSVSFPMWEKRHTGRRLRVFQKRNGNRRIRVRHALRLQNFKPIQSPGEGDGGGYRNVYRVFASLQIRIFLVGVNLMRKFMALVLLSAFALSITGCGGKADRIAPGRSPSACIGGEADKIEISHFTGGAETRWTVEGEKAEALRNWAGGLKYEILEAPEGQSPGDADGGEVYDFILPEGDCPGFSYVIHGSNRYLLMEGYWYTVTNPSDPPCMVP